MRHVNDELKLQRWRQAVVRRNKLKKGNADADADGNAHAFIDIEQEFQDMQTESGIRNWHLMVPSWGAGEISQKSKRKEEIKIKRELREWANRENEKVQQKLILKRQREQVKVDYAAVGLEKGKEEEDKLTVSIMEGLKKRRKLVNGNGNGAEQVEMVQPGNVKQRGGDNIDGTSVSFLCTLSGDLVVEDNIDNSSTSTEKQHTSAMTMIQSKSEFATAAILASAEKFNSIYSDYNGLYYEVTIETGGIAQIGWATSASASAHNTGKSGFLPNSDTGDGVGDDKFSYGYDGLRGKVFHDGEELDYGPVASSGSGSGSISKETDSSGWKKGDVIGCLYDFTNGTISFSVNGKDYGKAFDVEQDEKGDRKHENGNEKQVLLLYPSLSLNENEIVGINIGPTFRHCPYNGNAKKTKAKKTKAKKTKKEEHQYLAISSIVVDQNDGKCSEEEDLEELNVKQKGSETGGEDAIIGSVRLDADANVGTNSTGTAAIDDTTGKTTDSNEPIDLEKYMAVQELEALGMDRLKEELYRLRCKCGGSLSERAKRLYSLKGLLRDQIPLKVRGKNFDEAVP